MEQQSCFFCKRTLADGSKGTYFPEDETYMCEECLKKMAEPVST